MPAQPSASIRHVGADQVSAHLPMRAAVDALRQSLLDGLDPAEDLQRCAAPLTRGRFLMMPSEVGGYAGIKILTLCPDDAERELPTIQGAYLLHDAETLSPLAMIDGTALTAVRTPAVSALGVDLLAEREARHTRMGDSRYVVEPNVKDGKGGLRDLHTLFWIAKYVYRVRETDELLERGVFDAQEYRTFRRCADFLWSVRCNLHFFAGRAEERERLAREIHDTVAQGLSSILLVARAARAGLAAGNTRQVQRQLAVIEEGAGENLAQARRFVRDLAAVPEGPGLPEALTVLCRRTEAQEAARGQRLECSLRLEGREATQLPEPVQTALLRGAQASLANVTAHAGAARAVLTLTVSAEEALLDVYDDGVGFDPATLEDPRAAGGSDSGYGLPGLRRRLQTLGGSLTVDSAPEEGTVIGMRLPLTSATGDAVGSASTADDASEETAESAAALDAAAGTAGRVAGAAPSAGPRETQDGRRG